MTTLVDSNMSPIPVCNISNTEEPSSKFFVEDQKIYQQHKKNKDFYGTITASNCIVTSTFLIIFSLNSAAGIFSIANLFLLVLIIITGVTLVYSFKKWTASSTIVIQMELDGTPCVGTTTGETTILYTNNKVNHF